MTPASAPMFPPIDSPLRHHDRFTDRDVQSLLYGVDTTERVVSTEFRAPNHILLYQRQEDNTTETQVRTLRPWLIAKSGSLWESMRPQPSFRQLRGKHPLATLVEFDTWEQFRRGSQKVPSRSNDVYQATASVSQYLMQSGVTLFKGMVFEDLRRLQLDIETLGLDPKEPDARVIMIAMRQGEIEELLILETDEANLLERFVEAMNRFDPDVIEGHNIFNFDFPYLAERARQHGVSLSIGRDGSTPFISEQTQRFRAGPISLPYTLVHVHGRHIVDTYQQVQRFDTAGRLTSYGLKNAVRSLGLERDDREFVAGEEIADLWRRGERDGERLSRYALDDVRDVDMLARITLPTEFYQTQILPMTYQRTTITGTGRKIDDLMVRSYLAADHSLPTASEARPYPGGFVELLQSGVFGPIVKCDVESLYPSIMLHENMASSSDTLHAFPILLRELTNRRIDAKRRVRITTGEERATWDGLQGSFKVLINSFYGYLGFGGGLFNDYDVAERVTLEGQRLIQEVVANLHARNAGPIEVDTDGVYFTLPLEITSLEDEERFVDEVGWASLPPGIRLAHDGRYARMLSLKLKTYALLDHDGVLTLKGSALRSRRMERCFLRFIHDAALGFLTDQRGDVRNQYFDLASRIQTHTVPPEDISQWTMVNRATLDKLPRLQTLLGDHPNRWRFGERIQVYERHDGSLAFIDDYAQDENTRVLLRKLSDTAARFAEAFPSPAEFAAFFPRLRPATRLEEAREARPVRQLGLF